MLTDQEEENPFRPGGDLSREVEEVLKNSTISRQAVVIRDPNRLSDSEIAAETASQSAPTSARHSAISNGNSTLRSGRHGKQLHSVHFSPNDPKLHSEDNCFFPNKTGESGEIIEGTVYRHYLGSPILDNNNKSPLTNGVKANASSTDGCAFSADSVQHVKLKGDDDDDNSSWVLSSEAIVQTIEETKPLQAERIVIKTQKKRPCCKMM